MCRATKPKSKKSARIAPSQEDEDHPLVMEASAPKKKKKKVVRKSQSAGPPAKPKKKQVARDETAPWYSEVARHPAASIAATASRDAP